MDILTDNYPAETSWEVKNVCTNEIVRTSEPYAAAATFRSDKSCLPNGRWTFSIKDSYGDG